MRISFLLSLSIASAVAAAPARADRPLLLDRPDLHAHTWLSFSLALTLTEVLEGPDPTWGPNLGTVWSTLIATGVVGLIGVGKELTDDTVSGADLAADATGLLLNGVVQVSLRF